MLGRPTPLKLTFVLSVAFLLWMSLGLVGRSCFCFGEFLFGSFVGILVGPIRSGNTTLWTSMLSSFLLGTIVTAISLYEVLLKSPYQIFDIVIFVPVFAYFVMLLVTGCIGARAGCPQ